MKATKNTIDVIKSDIEKIDAKVDLLRPILSRLCYDYHYYQELMTQMLKERDDLAKRALEMTEQSSIIEEMRQPGLAPARTLELMKKFKDGADAAKQFNQTQA
jgi:uncharacterized coiled-coil DUF342 family protein